MDTDTDVVHGQLLHNVVILLCKKAFTKKRKRDEMKQKDEESDEDFDATSDGSNVEDGSDDET